VTIRDPNGHTFTHFLQPQRKAARKSEDKVYKQGIHLTRNARQLKLIVGRIDFLLLVLSSRYANAASKVYLTREFFGQLADTSWARKIVLENKLTGGGEETIGGSCVFSTIHSLYGRYWVALES